MSFSNGTQMKSSVINSDGTPAAAAAPNTTTTRVPGPGRPQSYSSLYNNSKDTSDRLLWEMRVANRTPNTTPVSTVLNSPDLTDLDTKMRYQHSTLMQHHQIKVGRSPVGSGGANDSSNNSSNPSSPIQAPPGDGFIGGPGQTVYNRWHMMQQQQQLHHHQQPFGLLSDGEMVVFDDIDGGVSGGSGGGGGCDWRGLANRDILGSSPVPSENEDDDDEEDFDDGERNYYDVDSTKIQRIIGGLTIAEYEGSPRRFGNIDRDSGDPPGNGGCGDGGGSSSSIGAGRSTGAARPGFPKRVISPSISDTRPGSTEGTRGATQTAELIDLNDDPDRTGGRIPLSSSSCISDSKFNLTYVDYFTSNTPVKELEQDRETTFDGEGDDQQNRTPTNISMLANRERLATAGGDSAADAALADDYFFAYSVANRNAQSNSYVGHRLANKAGEGNTSVGSSPRNTAADEQEQYFEGHLSNNYPYYHKYNHSYHYSIGTNNNNAQQLELHNNQSRYYQQSYYQSNNTGSEGGMVDGFVNAENEPQNIELYIDPGSGGGVPGDQINAGIEAELEHHHHTHFHSHSHIDSKLRNFTLSPETTDYDSNCGDLDSEVSLRYIGNEYGLSGDLNGLTGHGTGMDSITDYGRLYSSMPILEDGLSSGHASDTENNLPPLPMHQSAVIPPRSGISIVMDRQHESFLQSEPDDPTINLSGGTIVDSSEEQESGHPFISSIPMASTSELEQQPEEESCDEVQEAIKDIKEALQKTKILPTTEGNSALDADHPDGPGAVSPVWVPRSYDKSRESLDSDAPVKLLSADEEEADTDLETDRLLGQQRLDDHGFGDEKSWMDRPKIRSILAPSIPLVVGKNHTAIRAGVGTQLSMESPTSKTPAGGNLYGNGGSILLGVDDDVTGGEKEELKLAADKSPVEKSDTDKKSKRKTKEVLIEGVLFRARYLGSTQLVCEGQPTKSTRMMQAEEAVSRIKAPEGESQPSTEVELFVSTEKIMVLNTDLKEIMMDHALRTISYIADIGDLVVLMARRRFVPQDTESVDPAAPLTSGQQPAGQTTKDGTGKQQDDGSNDNSSPPPKKSLPRGNRTPKMICHVFESEEAQFIAQSIGQAFQVAYMDFLKANGIEDHSFMKEMDYQEVLNSQEIFGDELEIFAKKELQKEVVVPKAKGEILGVVIVESGWGSMLPTVVIANLASTGAAARCGQLNIGDQIIAINGLSLVGLPLSTCQGYIKNTKNQTAVKFTVVPCAPVVEVKIKRPNTKYQLGFSVQNGVICSLLRGGIAERGGVRVGHRIIEINNQSVVAVPHEKIVNLLATSVGEIHMKTMPTSMFRLLTGQENPVYI
ncbi:uncharacterized protein LOC129738131 isoform X2 [Uranotaenia lowii]|uniref:uncharacterized protein LOC129738131 isoform X2 n=1 Tax=Uranotaenia lowii TaxID=190385 RepID=UPI0024791D2F|nr:uncharacterized protein LOC129738131 isoform X2 [Uranotaenia lowii]